MHSLPEALPILFQSDTTYSRDVEWGEMNVAFEAFPAGTDTAPLFKGLPDGRCQCPHWGYLFKGRMRVTYAAREEVITAYTIYQPVTMSLLKPTASSSSSVRVANI